MKHLVVSCLTRPVLFLASACLIASCANHVDMPKGSHKVYHSARLVQRDPGSPAITDATEKQVHGMVQNSIARQFASKGMDYGKSGAELAVGYMVIYQEPGMTASYDRYFGYGRDSGRIAEVAHNRGALDNDRPDFFRQAGIIIDIIDTRDNKLVYRNIAKGDVIKGASSGSRAARIDVAVGQALADFFR